MTAVLQNAATLLGPLPDRVLEPVPAEDMRRAIADSLPALLADLRGDERNVLLTLAAMVVTLRTGVIVPKDVAARRVAEETPEPHRSSLELAAAGFLGEAEDDWTARRERARAAAEHLAGMVRYIAGGG